MARDMPNPWSGAYQFFLAKGWSHVQAAGIVGGLRGETAGLNPTQTHDQGIGLGISGWNGQRLQALKDFADQRGTTPTDLNTQLEFVHHELNTSEARAGKALHAASTPAAAGNAMLAYFRPKDWNVPGAHPERAQYAQKAYDTNGSGLDSVGRGYDSVKTTTSAVPSTLSNVLTMAQPAQERERALQVLGMVQPKPTTFTPSPVGYAQASQTQMAPMTPATLAGPKVVGPVSYPELAPFEIGKPQSYEHNGRIVTLHPVDYDPFANEVSS